MTSAPRSLLAADERMPLLPALALAAVLHVVIFAAAFLLPRFFDSPPPLRKPIIAHLVALGRPRDPRLLPRKESPPPTAAAAPAVLPVPSRATAAPAPAKRPPSRQELMQRALAHAAGRATPEDREPPDPERAGQATGSALGTAATAEEGDEYFTAVHDAIHQNYVVPSVISERERMYLAGTVVVWIGPDGRIIKHDFQKKSCNTFFDQALVIAIEKTKVPPPPPDLVRLVRDTGIALEFKP
ncbi:MAG: TonB C-terminal domain-containing protein [Myxococcales bacterium]